ncbi:hypothetical protein [Psychrobacter vallis]|uniref:hypothetical protein n=1 Tax=Psychrobacter vallis TaxID=248451 RepID=UPI00191B74D1|nr:hypothetical protein [Psychrobacter vallis]
MNTAKYDTNVEKEATVMGSKNAKKWVLLAAVATALLIVPRRSSRKADITLSNKKQVNANNDHVDSAKADAM